MYGWGPGVRDGRTASNRGNTDHHAAADKDVMMMMMMMIICRGDMYMMTLSLHILTYLWVVASLVPPDHGIL